MDDLAALQGTWNQVGCAVGGEQMAYDALGVQTVFTDTRFIVRSAQGDVLLSGIFRLNPAADPKTVDWIDDCGPDAGKILPGIYKLEKDSFTFAAADEGQPRPVALTPGPGLALRAFVRCPAR